MEVVVVGVDPPPPPPPPIPMPPLVSKVEALPRWSCATAAFKDETGERAMPSERECDGEREVPPSPNASATSTSAATAALTSMVCWCWRTGDPDPLSLLLLPPVLPPPPLPTTSSSSTSSALSSWESREDHITVLLSLTPTCTPPPEDIFSDRGDSTRGAVESASSCCTGSGAVGAALGVGADREPDFVEVEGTRDL